MIIIILPQDSDCPPEDRESGGGGGFGDHDFEPKVKQELKMRKRGRPKKLDESTSMPDEDEDVFVHDDDDDDYEGTAKQGKTGERERVLKTVTCKICGKERSKNHMDRHLRLAHKVELEKRGRGRPKKGQERYDLDEYIELPKKQEYIGLDEYMSMVDEKENKFVHDDKDYDLKEMVNAPEVAAKPSKFDEEGRKLEGVTCKFCGKTLSKNGHLDRHIRSFHPEVELKKRGRGRPRAGEERDPDTKRVRKDREANNEWHGKSFIIISLLCFMDTALPKCPVHQFW